METNQTLPTGHSDNPVDNQLVRPTRNQHLNMNQQSPVKEQTLTEKIQALLKMQAMLFGMKDNK